MSKLSRRHFLQVSSAAGLSAGVGAGCASTRPVAANTLPGRATANDKIVLGFIGVAGRGTHLLEWFSKHDDVAIGAVCDVYDTHCERAAAKVKALKGTTPKTYKDFRNLLEQKDLDAVVCAAPPHWHALILTHACEAGKDIYCEKPMCLSPIEADAMVRAARLNHRVTQIGTQIHAGSNYHHVVDIVRSGILGTISNVETVLCLNEAPAGIGKQPNTNPPSGLDWDMWCGPAPLLPYNATIFGGGRHRYVKELIGSWIHEMGPHIVDLPVWAMDMGEPKSASAVGGKFATDDISTIPDTLTAIWEYDGYVMKWTNLCASSHGLQFNLGGKGITRRLGVSFHGTNGTLWSNYSDHGIYVEGERIDKGELPPAPPRTWASHDREFLNSVKSRERCSCDVEYHRRVHAALNLGNLAFQVGRKIHWDADQRVIIGDDEANQRLQPNYRAPWALPV